VIGRNVWEGKSEGSRDRGRWYKCRRKVNDMTREEDNTKSKDGRKRERVENAERKS
jgi:hypothetical protein